MRYVPLIGRILFTAIFLTSVSVNFSEQGIGYADAAGVPLQSGMSCAELLTLSKTGEQHSPIAGALYAQYCAAVVIPPPTGGGGGGGARTQ